jgi:hypothetical protein
MYKPEISICSMLPPVKEEAEPTGGSRFGRSGLRFISRSRQAESLASHTLMRRWWQATMTGTGGVVILSKQVSLHQYYTPVGIVKSTARTNEKIVLIYYKLHNNERKYIIMIEKGQKQAK